MANVIITDPAQYDSIRRAIDVTIDADVDDDADRLIPNAVIEDILYLPAAEAEVIGIWPAAGAPDDLTETQRAKVRLAVILLTAARLAVRVPIIAQERRREHQYQRVTEQPQVIADRLRGEAMTELQGVVPEEIFPGYDANAFTTVGHRRYGRGRYCRY